MYSVFYMVLEVALCVHYSSSTSEANLMHLSVPYCSDEWRDGVLESQGKCDVSFV